MLNPFISVDYKVLEIVKVISQEKYSVRFVGLTYRTISHYDEIGLFMRKKSKSNNWRKLSILEIIWLKIVKDLRMLGIGLEIIIKLKENLFNDNSFGRVDKVQLINNSFEVEIANSIFSKTKLYLILFEDGTYSFQDNKSLKQVSLNTYQELLFINIPLDEHINDAIRLIR